MWQESKQGILEELAENIGVKNIHTAIQCVKIPESPTKKWIVYEV